MTAPATVRGFPPVCAPDARVLVLGSMPGTASLRAAEYYAHGRNRFWPIMGELVGALPALPYPQRLQRLIAAGIALWDVMDTCEREGSLDSAIRDSTVKVNDFHKLLGTHTAIQTVLFNGAKAENSFRRFVIPSLGDFDLTCRRMPSTSPANASQGAAFKIAAWRDGLRAANATLLT